MAHIIFSEMGFSDVFSVPMANAENQALENKLQRKRKEKADLENKISQHKEATQALTDFMKNLKQELSHIQALSEAVEKETGSEKHLQLLADREMGCLQQKSTQLEKELQLLREKKNTLESDLLKGSQKQEKIQNQLNWDQQTLDAWLTECAQDDEDTMVLLKYCRQDEAKIKELTLSIDRATEEVNQKHKALEKEWTKTKTVQVELDRVSEDFHRAHSERQELIHQWQNAIEQMRKRDSDLEQCIMSLTQLNQEMRERQDSIAEKKSQQERQEKENQECERNVEATKQLAAKLRVEFLENERCCVELKSEFEGLRITVEQVATEVETTRSQLTSLNNDNKERISKLRTTRATNAALEQKLKGTMALAVGVEGVASRTERILEEVALSNNELESVIHHHHRVLSQKMQELQALKSNQESSVAVISRTRDALRSLHNHFNKVEKEYIKGEELIQVKDYQIKLAKEKLKRLKGEQQGEEDQALKREESQLLKALGEKKRTTIMLSQQLRTSEVETRCVKKAVERVEMQRKDHSSKLVEMELCNEMSQKELKKLTLKNQESLVDHNLLKLDAKRVRDRLTSENDCVIALEKKKMNQEVAMREKELEIDFNRDVLQTQVRIGNQENQSLRMELNEILSKVEKMKTKYETLRVPMMSPDGDGDQSLEYYMIKAAQGREELKRRGNELDEKVRKKETEIEALENTLHAIRTEHRRVSGMLSDSTEDYQKLMQLEEQKRAMEEKYKLKTKQIRDLQQDNHAMNNTLDNLQQEETSAKVERDENRAQILTLKKEVDVQKEKLQRVNKQCLKLTAEIRSSKKTKNKTEEESDIELCQLKDFDKMVERMLLEAMAENPELRCVLHEHFRERNLSLPVPVFPTAIHLSPGQKPVHSLRSVRSSMSSVRVDSPLPPPFKPSSFISSTISSSCPIRSARFAGSVVPRPSSPTPRVRKPASQVSSVQSSISSNSGSPGTSGQPSPRLKTVDLGLQLKVTSALCVPSQRDPKRASSETSRSTSSKKSQGKGP